MCDRIESNRTEDGKVLLTNIRGGKVSLVNKNHIEWSQQHGEGGTYYLALPTYLRKVVTNVPQGLTHYYELDQLDV